MNTMVPGINLGRNHMVLGSRCAKNTLFQAKNTPDQLAEGVFTYKIELKGICSCLARV